MRKLAKNVGVTAPALYRHYDGKEKVLADVVREAYQAYQGYVYRALQASTPIERFFQAGEGYLDFALEHPRWYKIMFSSPERLGMKELPDDIEAMGWGVHQFWIDRVRECMQVGILKEADPLQTALTMWAHAHGMILLYHQGFFPMDQEEFESLFEKSGARMMSGFATPSFSGQLEELYMEDQTAPHA
jgi:AcrR family transcriptional regulator